MDRFLSSFSDKSSAQKTLIVIGGSIVLLLFLAVSYFLTTPTQNNGQSLPGQNVAPSSVPLQTAKRTSFGGKSVSYASSYYSITYPDSFSYEEGQIPGGGTSLLLRTQSQDSSNTVIEIQTYDTSSVASQSAIENVFLAFNYKQSPITVFNTPGVEYKGLVSNGGVSLRESVVIFTYQNRIYKLQLTYSGMAENSDAEQVFQKIVASFKPPSGY